MAQKKVNAVIHSQEKLAEGIYSMWLDAPEMAKAAVPGQFIAVYTNDQSKLLPRPISLCEIDKDKKAYLHLSYPVPTLILENMYLLIGSLGNGFPDSPVRPVQL